MGNRKSTKIVVKEWLLSLFVAFIIAMFIRTFFIQPYRIPTGSMIPTLQIGDHPLVNKLVYKMREPKRGEIVVFIYPVVQYGCTQCAYRYKFLGLFNKYSYNSIYEYPEDSAYLIEAAPSFEELPDDWVCPVCGASKEHFKKLPRKPFIKRLIGLPGETIKIDEEGRIHINGKLLTEPESIASRRYISTETYGRGEIKIPEGYYYVLGDNVYNSKDSRYWGFVPKENLIGQAIAVYWPPRRIRIIK